MHNCTLSYIESTVHCSVAGVVLKYNEEVKHGSQGARQGAQIIPCRGILPTQRHCLHLLFAKIQLVCFVLHLSAKPTYLSDIKILAQEQDGHLSLYSLGDGSNSIFVVRLFAQLRTICFAIGNLDIL